jgi:hypothetical protein
VLAFCNIRTIYLRNVPDDVVGRLERLAARAGMSLSAFTVRELSEVSRRADNAATLDGLPSRDLEVSEILGALDESRSRR